MIETIAQNITAFMLVGILIIVGVSQFNRVLGGILGILFWASVAVVGAVAYDKGGALGFPGLQLSRVMFYGLCGLFVFINVAITFNAWRGRSTRRKAIDIDSAL